MKSTCPHCGQPIEFTINVASTDAVLEMKLHDADLCSQSWVSAFLNVSESTLEKWRCTGEGPAFIKAGRAVLYQRSAIHAWLAARTVSHTHQTLGRAGRKSASGTAFAGPKRPKVVPQRPKH